MAHRSRAWESQSITSEGWTQTFSPVMLEQKVCSSCKCFTANLFSFMLQDTELYERELNIKPKSDSEWDQSDQSFGPSVRDHQPEVLKSLFHCCNQKFNSGPTLMDKQGPSFAKTIMHAVCLFGQFSWQNCAREIYNVHSIFRILLGL